MKNVFTQITTNESTRAPLRVDFIKGDAQRLKDRSLISDVSQSPSLIPSCSSLFSNFKARSPHDLTTLPLAFIAQ